MILNKILYVTEGEMSMENLNTSIWTDEEDGVSKARISVLIFATCLAACEMENPPITGGAFGTSSSMAEECTSC